MLVNGPRPACAGLKLGARIWALSQVRSAAVAVGSGTSATSPMRSSARRSPASRKRTRGSRCVHRSR